MENLVYIIAVIAVAIAAWYILGKKAKESFYGDTGTFCRSCDMKTPNQCANCFNCGFCVDKFGNGSCIGGDSHGPYNKEACGQWYYAADDWGRALQDNRKGCEIYPKPVKRII